MNQITRIILEKANEAITAILSLPVGVAATPASAPDAPKAEAETPPAPPTPETPAPKADAPEPPAPEAPKAETPPAPPAPEPPAPKADVELDSEGLPWDERIHGAGKTFMKADGTWKLKRGVDPVLVGKVKTELRGTYAAPEPRAEAPAPPAPPSAPKPPSASGTIDSWAELKDFIDQDNIDPELVEQALTKFGQESLDQLKDAPILIPLVYKELV